MRRRMSEGTVYGGPRRREADAEAAGPGHAEGVVAQVGANRESVPKRQPRFASVREGLVRGRKRLLRMSARAGGRERLCGGRVVSVLDPAGNSATVLDREINVENPVPAAAQVPAAAPAKPTPKQRARLTLNVTPHTVRGNRRVYFSGRLLGGHISKLGKLLVLAREAAAERRMVGDRPRSKPARRVGSMGATGSAFLGPGLQAPGACRGRNWVAVRYGVVAGCAGSGFVRGRQE